MQFSDREASILLGATLMHWGVPFRFAAKRNLTDDQQLAIDQASDKLIALRQAQLHSQSLEIDLSAMEIALLVDVVEDCIKECGNDAVELRLQLHADGPAEVEALLERMRSLQSSRQVAHN
jgi:hypothetical protein